MRKKPYWIEQLLFSAGPLILLSSVAWAEPPDQGGEGWDDRHMRSNFARRLGERTTALPIVGGNRYGELATSTAAAPPTRVHETILSINPHGWQPGGPSGGTSSAPRWTASGSGFSETEDARPSRTSSMAATTSSASSRHRGGSR